MRMSGGLIDILIVAGPHPIIPMLTSRDVGIVILSIRIDIREYLP